MRRALSFLLPAAKLAPIPIGLGIAAYFVLLESYAAGPLASVGLALAAIALCAYAGVYFAARVLAVAAPPSPLADPAKPYRLQVAAETPDGLAAVAASVLARWPREPGPAKGRVCYRLTAGGAPLPVVESTETAPDAPRRLAFPVALRRAEGGGWLAECPTIPGCATQGRDLADALVAAREAIALCLETRAAEGRTWSPPDAAAVVELDAPADLEPGAPAEAPRGSGPAAEVAARWREVRASGAALVPGSLIASTIALLERQAAGDPDALARAAGESFDPRAAMRRHFAAWCEARKAARDAAPWLQAAGAARLADALRDVERVGAMVDVALVRPGSIVEGVAEGGVTVRLPNGCGWHCCGHEVVGGGWQWPGGRLGPRVRLLAADLTEAECAEAAAMSSADARAWCEARFAASIRPAPAEAAAPEPLPEAASAPADPAPTQAPAEAAEALARLRELQATALPTRRIRDELTAPPAVGDLVEAEQVPPGSVVERAGGCTAGRWRAAASTGRACCSRARAAACWRSA